MSESPPSFPAQRCADCGLRYGHGAHVCRQCGSEAFEDAPLSGEGTVYARTTIRIPGSDQQGEEPFEVAVVDVGGAESVRVTARIEENPGLGPDDPVEFVERRNGVFYFRAV
ncbi:Zn-ribbon domain-containing OB-fold protein [Haloprofundus salilacus]|uniref:Zn-ribbon domain-containing OB-fold protein n=1 Tax=Haloprofundus salilacus TaxID=2876190 RepID=UPI001CCA484E|nr:OB-fold domain-containing protein [Haloprofundus salilacus]